ncbi:F0F1 ATP synthase subunit B [Enterococcus sp. LJL98]
MLNHLILLNAGGYQTTISSIVVVTGSFVLLLVLIKHFAWGQIVEVFQKREDQINHDLDSAEEARINAKKHEEAIIQRLANSREEATAIVKDAKQVGESNRQALLDQTKEEVARMKAKAEETLLTEKEQALVEVKEEVAKLSIQLAEKILAHELSLENQELLINQYIEDLGSEDGK